MKIGLQAFQQGVTVRVCCNIDILRTMQVECSSQKCNDLLINKLSCLFHALIGLLKSIDENRDMRKGVFEAIKNSKEPDQSAKTCEFLN